MSKTNDRIFKIIRIGIEIAVFLFCVGVAYATISSRVTQTEIIATATKIKADNNELDIVEIKTDIKYIRKSVDNTASVQQEILKEIRK